jgi:coenzyme F420 hydrogenase subunit beta
MKSRIRSVADVFDWRLCLGCGACAYICPEQKIRLVDDLEEGIRPLVKAEDCASCTQCLEVCPAVENDRREINTRASAIAELRPAFGPVLEVWEGHASDPEIRHAGSSGGLLTALSLYCLEREGMYGVLQVGMNPSDPTRNQTRLSRSRAELLANTGSRYAPASVCDGLHLVEQSPSPCVVVGQPSEVTALRKAQCLRPGLADKTGLVLSFFCAGSPSRKGTLELLKSLGVEAEKVGNLRYRGNGWPGMFSVTLKGQTQPARQISYQESWGFVQAFRPFATHLCPDGSGEDADISCGDPWYREVEPGEPGSSLVVVRTGRGRQLLQGAMKAGYVSLQRAEAWKMTNSQRNLIAKRGAIGGRVAMLRLLGLPTPQLKGFSLWRNWLKLSWNQKLRSTIGTLRRVVTRGYFRPKAADESNCLFVEKPSSHDDAIAQFAQRKANVDRSFSATLDKESV